MTPNQQREYDTKLRVDGWLEALRFLASLPSTDKKEG